MIKTKRTLAAFIAAITLITAISVLAFAAAKNVCGDVDLDGRVSGNDATLIYMYCNGTKELSERALKNADVNLDGKVTRDDALLILKYIVGDIKSLPVKENADNKHADLEFISDNFPEGGMRLNSGESYGLRGRVVSNAAILSVRIVITDIASEKREVDEKVEFSSKDKLYEYDVHSSKSALDPKIKFAGLKNGQKTIQVYASDANNENKLLFTGKFRIGFSVSELSGYVYNKGDAQDRDLLYDTLDFLNEIDIDSPQGKILSEAVKMLGTSYSEVDCSKFTQTVFKKALGITLPGTAAEQAKYCVNNDLEVDLDSLKTGDLVFWQQKNCFCGRYGEIHHVAIYVGRVNGVHLLIESVTSRDKVVIRPMWGEDTATWQLSLAGRVY